MTIISFLPSRARGLYLSSIGPPDITEWAAFAPLQYALFSDNQERVHVTAINSLSERLLIAVTAAEVDGGDDASHCLQLHLATNRSLFYDLNQSLQ